MVTHKDLIILNRQLTKFWPFDNGNSKRSDHLTMATQKVLTILQKQPTKIWPFYRGISQRSDCITARDVNVLFFCDRTVPFLLPLWKKNFVSFRFCLKYKNKQKTFLSISISKEIFLKTFNQFFSFFVFRFCMGTFRFFKTKFPEYNESNIIELVKFYGRLIRY